MAYTRRPMETALLELSFVDLSDQAQQMFETFTYLGPFLVLLLCGVGLPLPEEVTLIGSGILVHQGKADFVLITMVCSVAILMGDSIPYTLGRRYGKRVLRFRWVSKLLHPERFARVEKRFLEHGDWATFACRFLPGIRIPGYFIAGTMQMKFWRFILLDGIGVLISVPISIYLGKLFADHIDQLKDRMANLHLILAFLVLALVIILLMVGKRNRAQNVARRKAERAKQKQQAAGAGPVPPVEPQVSAEAAPPEAPE